MRLILEFDPGDPPSGRVVRDDEEVDEFSGRLELYAALERARAAVAASETEKGPERGPLFPKDVPPAT
jgi:hypothetical protein